MGMRISRYYCAFMHYNFFNLQEWGIFLIVNTYADTLKIATDEMLLLQTASLNEVILLMKSSLSGSIHESSIGKENVVETDKDCERFVSRILHIIEMSHDSDSAVAAEAAVDVHVCFDEGSSQMACAQ